MNARLLDCVSIVTGVASGIGQATALRLVAEGSFVVGADTNPQGSNAFSEADPSRFTFLEADVSEVGDSERLVRTTVERHGRLNIVANMHGISEQRDTTVEATPVDVFTQTWEVNARAVFLVCKAAIPHLRDAGGGAIVNMSSAASLMGGGGVAYSASKGALNALTRAVAHQYAGDNIRCNCVCPGAVETPMLHRSRKKLGIVSGPRPAGRIPGVCQPEEVAGLVAFLASDDARFITGATYTMDGGATGH